jgi:hypothetical protein
MHGSMRDDLEVVWRDRGPCVPSLARPRQALTRRAAGSSLCPGQAPLGADEDVQSFTPETVTLLTSVQRAAIEEWAAAEPDASPMLRALAETQIARAILEAASAGERDRAKLKQAALTEISFA